ncbi:MAG: hypothetical protein AB1725_11935 [Armatimonadota bacterium]
MPHDLTNLRVDGGEFCPPQLAVEGREVALYNVAGEKTSSLSGR